MQIIDLAIVCLCFCFSMLKLAGVVNKAGLVDGAAQESGGPLVASERGCACESEEVEHVLVHAEGAAVVKVQGADEDGTRKVIEGGWALNVGGYAGVQTIELVRLVFHD